MQILVATTPEEKEAVYRLRYECYVEELGWKYDKADQSAKTLRDDMDDSAVIYYAEDKGKVVATYCVHFGQGLVIPDKWRTHYDLDRFAEFPQECLSFSSRLIVTAEYRSTMVVPKMLVTAYMESWRRGTRFNFCFCRPRLIDLYERLGFIRYKENIFEPTQGYMSPMVLMSEDADHLWAVRSPFLRVCKSHRPDSRAARWFDQTFPEARHSTAKQTMTAEEFLQQWAQAMDARTVALLSGFSPEQIQKLFMAGTVLQCKAGDKLLREGEAGHEMFLIIQGSVRIYTTKADHAESLITLMSAGETFGELALVSRAKRNATVQAATELQVLVISQEFLQSAMRSMPDIAIKLLYNLASLVGDKLRATSERLLDMMRENVLLATQLARVSAPAPREAPTEASRPATISLLKTTPL
ncbi:MAG: cyclic nucleotide-binding domain-containing protein [Verrucomicrobiaceae bacterium]|nr:cyclic nucleotide-binding domain-containing protein [Verrucomicrobiaceae bacterium]